MSKLTTLMAGTLILGILAGCTAGPGARTGTGLGAIGGGVAGAVIDSSNPWRGAAIGAASGALLGYFIGDQSDNAAQANQGQGQSGPTNASTSAARYCPQCGRGYGSNVNYCPVDGSQLGYR